MVERSAAMTFAAGAFVFPGGRVDAADERLAGQSGDAARVAAIRECIEESGVAVGLGPAPPPDVTRAMQDALLAGEDFGAILERHGLALDVDALTPFARWLPGHEVSRRFDTRFFIARAPEGDWPPNADGKECVSARWVSARHMLVEAAQGAAKLIFPTLKTLQRLALHSSYAAIRDDALRHPVVTITPVIENDGATDFIRIPEGLGYPITRDPLDQSRRG